VPFGCSLESGRVKYRRNVFQLLKRNTFEPFQEGERREAAIFKEGESGAPQAPFLDSPAWKSED
jgi:hypothetical protein